VIFIDTGAFVARYVERDQYHAQAAEYWSHIRRSGLACLTSSFVLNETFTLLSRRATYEFAAERARNLYASSILEVLRPTEEEEVAAIEYLEKYADQQVSFTDCISFALMRARDIRDVFTFDRHFALAGFNVQPSSQPV